MKTDLTKDQRVMILSCINERASLYKTEIKKHKEDPVHSLMVKGYEKRLKTISELKEKVKLNWAYGHNIGSLDSMEVEIPGKIHPLYVREVIEGNMRKNSKYRNIAVDFVNHSNESDTYKITAPSNEAFFLIGMTVSEMIRQIK